MTAKNLKKSYGDRMVVGGVSLEINGGEIVGLLGPNGAGKTTTFQIIMGLVDSDGGEIDMDGVNIGGFPLYKRARAGMGYLPQEDSIFGKLTVFENLWAVAEYLPLEKSDRLEIVNRTLGEMKIAHLAKQRAYTVSGGERRRIEIARTLLAGPKFLLMDEPFSGVDPISVRDLQDIVIALSRENIGILITDHNVRETLRIVDRAYLMYGGEILCDGSSAVLLGDTNSRKLYLGEDFTM